MAGRLTADQVGTIRRWAEANAYIDGVRIIGSRTLDDSEKTDDINLLLTIVGGRRNSPDALYTRFGDLWRTELSRLLGISVGLQTYPLTQPEAKAKLDRTALILWTREGAEESARIPRHRPDDWLINPALAEGPSEPET
jgi:hypothetical protein